MLANMPSDMYTTLRRALQRRGNGDEDEDDDAIMTFIKKRRDATTPAHFRPITTINQK